MALHARHHCAHAGGADGVRHVHGRHLLPAAAALVRAGALLRLPPRLRHLQTAGWVIVSAPATLA